MHPENWHKVVSGRIYYYRFISKHIGLPVPRWIGEQERERERQLIVTIHNDHGVAVSYLDNIYKGVK